MSVSPKVSLIVARAKGDVIGRDNDMPWHVPEDLKYFKEKTRGKPVVMGRKTFESIVARLGKPLPNRPSFVISRQGYSHDDAFVYQTVEMALRAASRWAESENLDEIFVIGGASIYEAAMPYVEQAYITEIDMDVDGDAHFNFDQTGWSKTWEEPHQGYKFTLWKRQGQAGSFARDPD